MPDGVIAGGGALSLGQLPIRIAKGLLVAAVCGGLFWVVWIYGNGLRDPRYLDGWLLAVGMGLQIYFHIINKWTVRSPRSAMRWRKFHILLGYVLIAVFTSHCDVSLPDTGFEWALWTGFVLVAVSGIVGIYLAWSLRAKSGLDQSVSFDRIPARRAELAQEIRARVTVASPSPAAITLPAAPYDAWIMDLYTNHLEDFFTGPRNFSSHLVGSKHPLRRLTDEIDNLSRYVDSQGQDKLAAIRDLVVEKDQLDFARVFAGLTKGWLYVHVPATYALIVLSVVHVLVVYAFSSGAW